jgi:hypothetical protein
LTKLYQGKSYGRLEHSRIHTPLNLRLSAETYRRVQTDRGANGYNRKITRSTSSRLLRGDRRSHATGAVACAGVLVLFLLMTYGADLGPGFF